MKRAVVFTGLVRDEAKFITFLDQFMIHQDCAEVPFYFSTWFGELAKYPEVASRLQLINAIVLEQAQPNLVLNGHVLHQLVAWDLPFGLIDDDTFVYKSRPDFADFISFQRYLNYHPVKIENGVFESLFPEYRFLVKGMFGAQPFYLNDITFAGKVSDLRRLTALPLVNMVRYFRVGPEQLIWAPQFICAHSALDAFFRTNIGLIFNSAELSALNIASLQTDPAYLHALAFYFMVLEDGFDFFRVHPPVSPERIGRFTAEQLLWGAVQLPSLGHNTSCLTNHHTIKDYVQAILNGRVAPSQFGDHLQAAVATLRVNHGVFAPQFFKDSSEHYAAFSSESLKLPGAKVLRAEDTRNVLTGAAPDWHQADMGTSITEKLEAEINFLRRTVNQLELQLNPGRPGKHA